MGFWGIEVKPGKAHPYHSDNVTGKLQVTQATLGLGSSTEKSILQCSVGDKNPIFLCSLLPNKNESCSLKLEFDEDDLVVFSVIGPRSIHLAGYFEADSGDHLRDEYDSDSYGEDIAETETDESSEFDTEDDYGDDFIDDDGDELFLPSPVPNCGVVIEEIVDDDKSANGNGQPKRLRKKDQSIESEQQIVVKNATGVPVLESEDEDGFPISTSIKGKGSTQAIQMVADKERENKTSEDSKKKKAGSDKDTSKKRKVKNTVQDEQQERKKKKKKQKEKGEEGQVSKGVTDDETNDVLEGENKQELKSQSLNQLDLDNNADDVPSENLTEKKKKKQKKRKKKAQETEGNTRTDQTVSAVKEKKEPASTTEQIYTDAKSSQVRTFPNGLVIEEVSMGKPDGRRASPGKEVSVRYIGKLKKNGKIFDSNVGRAPYKFRLGIGNVIKGWDVGVNGMRVGDKRRLTIPPSMGYGAQGYGGKIPPNSWLVFDVELINVH